MRVREAIGRALGGILAPLAAGGSTLRGARLFHPDGVVYYAEVCPLAKEGALGEVSQRLAGAAIVRLSGAAFRFRGAELPDVLGVAVRFKGSDERSAAPKRRDQDLLFESAASLWQLPFAPFTTNTHDFLANTYYAILPFVVEGLGQVKWRLCSAGVTTTGKNRCERLEQAVRLGLAVLQLEVRPAKRGGAWVPVATIALRERAAIDQNKLEFSPFRDGLGIFPVGLLQSMRAVVYPASQIGRRLARGAR
jgi:hypothetical protein